MIEDTVYDMLSPTVCAMGYELWGIAYQLQGRTATLRIYIDHADGIGIQDCEQVSRQVSAILDVEDPIDSNYQLEISSPGLDRPLFKKSQYERFLGAQLKVKLARVIGGRRKYRGTLTEVVDDHIALQLEDGQAVDVAFSDIRSAHIVPSFDGGIRNE